MKVVAHPDVTLFWQTAGPLLAADPVRNTMPLGLVGRLFHGVMRDSQPILLTVHDGPDVVGAAVCTPPWPIVLGDVPPPAAAAMVRLLADNNTRLPGARGIRPAVEAFAAAWSERTGDEWAVRSDECLYQLGHADTDAATALRPPIGVPGDAVEGTEADVELLADWRRAFAVGEQQSNNTDTREAVRASFVIGSGQILWHVDGRPVSLAVVGMPREGVSRIGPVYTPPEFRGHGYGSAVTAAAARWALDRGANQVVLFTDLANPVSNSIYQRIGFTRLPTPFPSSFIRCRYREP